ncbi:MAG: glycerol kinase GlpK [Defluviitaleaceae bacterium]|nr:glycerol kinase GlpK [Defluviitaleaceae bacterium]
MASKFIMALDQGTTSSRCIIFNKNGQIVSAAQKEFTQIYPQAGWVEHDAEEIYQSQALVGHEAIISASLAPADIAAIGITNQRETTVIWDRATGKPIANAIVWQCRRTASICDQLREEGFEEVVQKKTGLKLDAYFSGTKVKWLLDNIPGAREKAHQGQLLFGTIDTWLIWKLTKGTIHATDHTNASRTMLYNIHTRQWDKEILSKLNIPECILPEVVCSSGHVGDTDVFGGSIPIAGIAGDQQAALYGQACFKPGQAKNTYGTGCFLLMNTGHTPVESKQGLITTMAASCPGKIQYALEGSVFIGGAVIQWLRDELGLISNAAESEGFAQSVADSNGVYLVPAFVGLGAPYWDAYARGTMVGLTRGANKAHIIRAALESMAYQTLEIMEAMAQDAHTPLDALQVDGGASANNFLMQFQADVLGVKTVRPKVTETTALGAAYLAGLATGYWQSTDDILCNRAVDREFVPQMDWDVRKGLVDGWKRAVGRALVWES